MKKYSAAILTSLLMISSLFATEPNSTKIDLSKDKILYVVGYAHLDSQWRWDYTTTINEFIKNTLE